MLKPFTIKPIEVSDIRSSQIKTVYQVEKNAEKLTARIRNEKRAAILKKHARNISYQDESADFGMPNKGSNSLQIPIKMLNKNFSPKQELRHRVTLSNFLIEPMSPLSRMKQSIQPRQRQKSMFTHNSSTQKNSRIPKQETQNIIHTDNLKRIQQCLNEDNLEKRLGSFSKQLGKNSIRVYKQDIHKLILSRYGKDRLTSFLDTEYIEDFNSVLKTMKELTSLKKQEMLIFCFLILDQNRDGLITVQDLIGILGLKQKTMGSHNQLILADVLKIYRYVETQQGKGDPIFDQCNNPILKDECLTFMKYRINNFRQKKHKQRGQPQRKCFLSNKLHNHLYSLRDETEEDRMDRMKNVLKTGQHKLMVENILKKLLSGGDSSRKIKKYECKIGEKKAFAVGFERYCQIYNYEIPKVFLDFLYLLGGLEMEGEQYLKIDISILKDLQIKDIIDEEPVDWKIITQRRLQKMFDFKKQLKVFKIKTKTEP